jgi:hypothetical protein
MAIRQLLRRGRRQESLPASLSTLRDDVVDIAGPRRSRVTERLTDLENTKPVTSPTNWGGSMTSTFGGREGVTQSMS